MVQKSPTDHDIVDAFLYPLLGKIDKYIPKKVTPNTITFIGFLFGISGSLTLILIKDPIALIICSALILLYISCDCLDGLHARNTNQTSILGYYVDVCTDQICTMLFSLAIMIRFDLFSPFFILVFFLRNSINTFAFISKSITGYILIPKVGPGAETILYCILFLLIFFFNDPIFYHFNFTNKNIEKPMLYLGFNNLTMIKSFFIIYFFTVIKNFSDYIVDTVRFIKNSEKNISTDI